MKEYALLEYLMRNAGKVVTRTMIAEHIWELDFDTSTNIIDVYINYLRNKIDSGSRKKADPYNPRQGLHDKGLMLYAVPHHTV